MKRLKRISLLTIIISALMLSVSCRKDRIEKTMNEYESINSYLNAKKQAEQVFVIDSNGTGPIVGNQGTRIWISKSCLQKPNGDTITWPYTVRLVELYKAKDIIYYQMPTVSSLGILENDGEIRLRAFKDDIELVFKPYPCGCNIEMPNQAPKSYMRVFYGIENSVTDWSSNGSQFGISSLSNPFFAHTDTSYQANIHRLGWIGCDSLAGNNTGTKLTFESSTDELQNVGIFIYMPSTRTVMQAYDMTSGYIPNNTSIKIVCIGINSNGELYTYYQTMTTGGNTTIDVVMNAISDADLTTLLNSL